MCQLVQATIKISKRYKCLQITGYYAKKQLLEISVSQSSVHTVHVLHSFESKVGTKC